MASTAKVLEKELLALSAMFEQERAKQEHVRKPGRLAELRAEYRRLHDRWMAAKRREGQMHLG